MLAGLDLHVVSVPLRHRFRGVENRVAVLIRGPSGWGEFSPFPEYGPDLAARWLAAALEAAKGSRPVPRRASVQVNVTIPAVAPEVAARLVVESSCRTAKVKVGGERLDDLVARVAAVRQALGPGGHLRLDANGLWDVETAVARLQVLAEFGLQYVEQPVASLEEMRELRRRVAVPLAADESVRLADRPGRVDLADAADVVVVKVQPLGGVRAALEVVERVGLPAVVSSAVETSVGLAAGLVLAAALDDLPFACGLGTALLLAGDVTYDPLLPRGGELAVREVAADPDLVDRWRADPATESEMMARLRLAADALVPLARGGLLPLAPGP